jgi:putative heme iron utilization protein
MGPVESDERFDGVRQLWAGRFQGVLATHSLAEPGWPFPTVVPYCLDRDGRPLLLLSHLALHTKNLDADPRCGLSVSEPTPGDVQQSLRLSCVARAERADPADQASHARWLRYYPDSRFYLEELNFRLYRLVPTRFHMNGGFAAARWLGTERVLHTSPFDERTELGLLDGIADLAPELERVAPAGCQGPIRLAGLDPWGLDLASGPCIKRIPFLAPVLDVEALRTALNAAVTAYDSAS